MIWSPWLREIVLWTVLRTHVEASLLIRTRMSPTARKTWLRSWNLSRSPRSSPRNSPWHSDLVNIQQGLYWKYVFGSLPVCCIGANQWPSSGGRIRNRYFYIKILSFFSLKGSPRLLSWNSSVLRITPSTCIILWTSPSPWKMIWKTSRTLALTSWGKCRGLPQISGLVWKRNSQ